MGVSLNGGTHISHPKCWPFLVGKPMVVGETHHFRKPPYKFCRDLARNLFFCTSKRWRKKVRKSSQKFQQRSWEMNGASEKKSFQTSKSWFWSNYSDLTRPHPNGGLGREIPLFQGNLGWWNITIWPDDWTFQDLTIWCPRFFLRFFFESTKKQSEYSFVLGVSFLLVRCLKFLVSMACRNQAEIHHQGPNSWFMISEQHSVDQRTKQTSFFRIPKKRSFLNNKFNQHMAPNFVSSIPPLN